MRRLTSASTIVLLALGGLTSPAWAEPRPGGECSPEGSSAAFDGTSMTCQQGRWVLEGPPPLGPGTPNDPVNPGSRPASSSVKPAKNFRTIGTALDAATFNSDGKQVADATGIRLPNGKIRLFAFVNSTDSLPGTLSATSTNKAGTRFTADATPPLPGVAAGQPRVVSLGGNSMRLFYVAGGNINAAVSNDGGGSFSVECPVITSAQAGFEAAAIV